MNSGALPTYGESLILRPDRQHCGDDDAGDAGERHEAGGEAKAEGGDRHAHEQDRTQQGDRRPTVVGQREGLGGAVGEGQKKVAPRVIEDLGFEAVYVTGAGVANMLLGAPDIGTLVVVTAGSRASR